MRLNSSPADQNPDQCSQAGTEHQRIAVSAPSSVGRSRTAQDGCAEDAAKGKEGRGRQGWDRGLAYGFSSQG